MKAALKKSPIPETHAFIIKKLKETVFDPTWHFHSEYQLFLVLKGRGTRFIGDNVKPFKEGEITFTGPNLPHLWKSDPNEYANDPICISEGVVIYFNDDIFGEQLLQKEESIRIRQLLTRSLRGLEVSEEIRNDVSSMIFQLLKLDGFDGFLQLLKILNYLSQSENSEMIASPGYTNTLKEGDTMRMNKVYDFVLKNFNRKITIDEMAKITNMTPTSFSRYFKIHANKTFSDFLSEIRIGHACKLLVEQNKYVSQSCYESGFQTLSNFNRQFKKITNKTPSEYQKAFQMA